MEAKGTIDLAYEQLQLSYPNNSVNDLSMEHKPIEQVSCPNS